MLKGGGAHVNGAILLSVMGEDSVAPDTRRDGSKRVRRTVVLAVLGCLAGLLTACASGTGGAIEVDQLKAELDTTSATHEYVIAVGDLLSIQVYGDEKDSVRGHVRVDGRITLPFLKDVEAVGKTPVQLSSDVEEGFKAFILNPQVTVVVEESAPLTISVLGEVAKPGPAPVPRDAGVADAVAAAGGLTPFAHKNRIYVVRQRPQPTRIHFTYAALTQGVGPAASFRLRTGDVVVVE
jgi:polysaccharide export outer membrane protein